MMNGYVLHRTGRLAARLRERGADAFVILTDEDTNWENLFYMSGFRGTSGSLIVYADGDAELTLDARYRVQGTEQSPHRVIDQKQGLVEDVVEHLKRRGAKVILCDAGKTFHGTWAKLSAHGGEWFDGGDILKSLRSIKDPSEIEAIKRSAALASKAFIEALDSVHEGMTEKEFESLLNYKICSAGGAVGFDMIVASGARSEMPHGRATDKQMKRGEWVTVDFGARFGGYFCDITRNFSIGAPSEDAAAMHDLILYAHRAGAAMLRAGASGRAAHMKALEVFGAKRVGQFFTHSLGHGFGLEIHESPSLSPRLDCTLRAGEIVTVEPGIYIPGIGGMRIEDDYLITEEGAERLTHDLPQELFVV